MPIQNNKPRRTNQVEKIKGLTGMAMGLIYIFVGALFVMANYKGLFDWGLTFAWIIGIFCALYGGYRIWRGWQTRKNAERKTFS